MNILFLYTLQDAYSLAKPLEELGELHFGISYIASFLKNFGHHVKLLILTRGTKYSAVDAYVTKFLPDLICFTAVASEYKFIANIARYIKIRYPKIFLLVGGSHVSLNPSDVILDSFDAICIGEGENPTLELCGQLEQCAVPADIANLWIKHGTAIQKNPVRPFMHDLDNLPFPDREMWQEWISNSEAPARASVLLGRGCPFECTYCCNHALKHISSGVYVRSRSPDNILAEILDMHTRFPTIKEIYLEVETLNARMKWAIELCSKLENFNSKIESPLSFGVNFRIIPNAKNENLFEALQRSNFKFINIGLESGSERVRREILNRNYSNIDVIETVNLARKYGLKVNFYDLIGIPGECQKDFDETVKINRICLPDSLQISIFFPYPGTSLYNTCKEKGLLPENIDTEMERSKAILDFPEFSRKQIQSSYIWFDYYVYRGHKPIYKLLARVIGRTMKTSIFMNTILKKITTNKLIKSLFGI